MTIQKNIFLANLMTGYIYLVLYEEHKAQGPFRQPNYSDEENGDVPHRADRIVPDYGFIIFQRSVFGY